MPLAAKIREVFFPAMERTKDRRGPPSMNTSPKAGVHRRLVPGPPFTGVPYWRLGTFIRRAKSEWRTLLAAGPLGPARSKISNCPRYTDTAWLGKARAAGPPDHRPAKRVGRHQAVYVRVQTLTHFDGTRPQWAGKSSTIHSNFARRNLRTRPSDPLP